MDEACESGRSTRALDLFRLVAMMVMIEGHTFTAILRPSIREALWGGYHDFVHGFTAPMFSFGSGFAFGLATYRALRTSGIRAATALRRTERYVTLVFLGYLMHVRAPSLAALLRSQGSAAAEWLVVDTLQCIGVTLLAAQSVASFVRSSRAFSVCIGAGLAIVVLGAPVIDGASLDPLPVSIAAYLNGSTGSLFPLFPWAGYVLFGILAVPWLTDANGALRTRVPLRAGLTGLSLVAAGIIGALHVADLSRTAHFWTSSPWLFLGRAGVACCVLAVTFAAVELHARDAGVRVPTSLVGVARESLVVYVVHLAILYGTPFTRSLRRPFERDADLSTASLVASGLLIFSFVVASLWNRLKREHGPRVALGRRFTIGAIVARFVLAG